jgi:catechol 2,3-dioxygenase-like lactoylglutathione lyase family enzyme
MGLLNIEGVTHWSIPVNNLSESEAFYGDLLGLKPMGRLGNSGMSCFNGGLAEILACIQHDIPA